MTAADATLYKEQSANSWLNPQNFAVQFIGAIVFAAVLSFVFDWLRVWPTELVLPIKEWITSFFRWLDKEATLGLFTVKDATRTISWMLKQPLIWTEYLLWKGAKPFQFLPVFWLIAAVVLAFVVYRLRENSKIAALAAFGLLAIVAIDGLPHILLSLSKALRADPWMEASAFIGISEWPGYLLDAVTPGSKIKALPWIAVVAGFAVFAHWVGGWRLAAGVALCMSYLAFTGLWRESMKTFSLVVVAVPFSAILGLFLGVWVTRSKRAASILTPMFDLMQATPHLAYLVPVVVMFGAGQVPALIATVIFAMPPMARCTILALQTVPSDVVESGQMNGCTPRQMLWKVQLPASQKTLLLGLNQVIMQTLAMVVIASLVGAQGLGHKLLFSLQQLKLGYATMQGIAIVLMAVVLDRLTQAYANRSTDYEHRDNATAIQQHMHLIVFGAVLLVSVIAAYFLRDASILSKKMLLIDNRSALELDKSIKQITFFLIDYVKPIRDWLTVFVLIPIRNFYQAMPWAVILTGYAMAGYKLGGWRLSVLVSAMFFFIVVLPGNWGFATTTFYYVSSALAVCLIIGLPLGIWAARSPGAAKVILTICDTLQTFPSFIYLLPAIMLFKVGELAIIFAIVPYATVPAIRYTYLGLKLVPEVTGEAARMSGATSWQRLWKVQLPIAVPEIMLGVNQTIMMALAMTAITALIGGTDLGQEIYRALPTSDAGRGVMAGLGIATLGIIVDRLIGAWADKRKRDLGLI
ncbi:MAG: ABC transporter permease [Rhizobiaceae bacterium]